MTAIRHLGRHLGRHLARLLLPTLLLFGVSASADEKVHDKVVYHIDDAATQATKALRNIRNHLDVSPTTEIKVVAHANGVDFLFDGAKDEKNHIEYAALVSALKARGVSFEVCEITLKNRGLSKDKFVLDADFTPSGVVRIAELQFREHYAYIKP